jgi:hypothetical protein
MRSGKGAFGINNSSPAPSSTTSPNTTYSPPSRHFVRSSHEKTLHRNSSSLDQQVDKALVGVLLSPHRLRKFSNVCKDQEDIFGHPNTKQRKKVQNRRRVLLQLQEEDPTAFLELAIELGLVESDATASSQAHREEQDSPLTPKAVLSALSLSTPPTRISPPSLLQSSMMVRTSKAGNSSSGTDRGKYCQWLSSLFPYCLLTTCLLCFAPQIRMRWYLTSKILRTTKGCSS